MLQKITFFLFLLALMIPPTYAHANDRGLKDELGMTSSPTIDEEPLDALAEKVLAEGELRIIVNLDMPSPFVSDGELTSAQLDDQRNNIRYVQNALLAQLAEYNAKAYYEYDAIPMMALRVDAEAFEVVRNSELVSHIQEDEAVPVALASSTAVIGAPTVWSSGFDGTGQTVVILDTGIDGDHPFFEDASNSSRIVTEACFSNAGGGGGNISLCPGGGNSQTGAGAAEVQTAACSTSGTTGDLCSHGVHVAGIAAGNGATFDGVAPNADIIPIQVFTRFNAAGDCAPNPAPCVLSYNSDQLAALNHVIGLNGSHTIASVNMSLGGGSANTSHCDANALKIPIDSLRSLGIATVIATGNDSWTNGISAPACISTAVSVGSTTDADTVSSFSNVHGIMDLFAPGSAIGSSVPGGGFASFDGTSMATPHVAGAWAILKQANPSASVTDVLDSLINTGVSVSDQRTGGTVTKPRIQLEAAVADLQPANMWQGSTSSDWTVGGNWSTGSAPNCLQTANIPVTANDPSIVADVTAYHLKVDSGATLHMPNNNTLTLCGNINITGTLNATDGTIVMGGTTSQSIDTANGHFHHLTVGSGNNLPNVTLDSDIDVNGNVTIVSGANLDGDTRTINVAGNWDEQSASAFTPSSSTVIFDGATQTLDKTTTSNILTENFSDGDGAGCGCIATLLPSGWSRENASGTVGWIGGDASGSNANVDQGAAIRWNDTPDAWLFTMAVNLQAGINYQISYDYLHIFNGATDTITVYVGNSAASGSMAQQVSTTGNFSDTSSQTQMDSFTVAASGTYYIGIRGQQVLSTGYVVFDNLSLTSSNGLAFYDLQVSSTGAATPNQVVEVTNNLTTNSDGTLDINGQTLTVEGTVTNNGTLQDTLDTPNSTTTRFMHIQNAAADTDKYEGVDITPTGGAMGDTTVAIRGNQNCTTDNTSQPVQRCFDIAPTTSNAATVRFYYNTAEANGNAENAVNIFHWNGASWDLEAGTTTRSSGANPRWVQVTGVANYSPFVLDNLMPTAVTLAQSEATAASSNVWPWLLGLGLLGLTSLAVSRRRRF